MSQDIATIPEFAPGDLLPAEELNSVITFEEAIAFAERDGLKQDDYTVIANPYTVLNKDKDVLLDKPFIVRMVRFAIDQETGNEYAVLYTVTRDNELYVITDGSTGIFKQILSIVNGRARAKHPTPFQHFLVANGLRKSEYGLTAEGTVAKTGDKVASKGATYYLA